MIVTNTSVHVPVEGRMTYAGRPAADRRGFFRCSSCRCSVGSDHVAGSEVCETLRTLRLESIQADD